MPTGSRCIIPDGFLRASTTPTVAGRPTTMKYCIADTFMTMKPRKIPRSHSAPAATTAAATATSARHSVRSSTGIRLDIQVESICMNMWGTIPQYMSIRQVSPAVVVVAGTAALEREIAVEAVAVAGEAPCPPITREHHVQTIAVPCQCQVGYHPPVHSAHFAETIDHTGQVLTPAQADCLIGLANDYGFTFGPNETHGRDPHINIMGKTWLCPYKRSGRIMHRRCLPPGPREFRVKGLRGHLPPRLQEFRVKGLRGHRPPRLQGVRGRRGLLDFWNEME